MNVIILSIVNAENIKIHSYLFYQFIKIVNKTRPIKRYKKMLENEQYFKFILNYNMIT